MNDKYYTGAVIKGVTDKAERKIYAKISDEVLDRDGEIIRLSAWSQSQLDEFVRKGAPLLVGHDYKSLPIGKILRFDLKGNGLFMEAQLVRKTRAADEAWEIISQVGSMSFSVGFISHKSESIKVRNLDDREKGSCLEAGLSESDSINVHLSVEMIEVSLVSVPSLETTALISYRAGSIKTKQLRDAIEREITIEPDEPQAVSQSDFESWEKRMKKQGLDKTLESVKKEVSDFKKQQIVTMARNIAEKYMDQKIDEKIAELKGKMGVQGKSTKEPQEKEIDMTEREITQMVERALGKALSKENISSIVDRELDKKIKYMKGTIG